MMRKPAIVILSLYTLLFCSCVYDKITTADCPSRQLSLSIGDMRKVETKSSALENECWISDAYIIVFRADGSYKDGEKLDISNAVANNGKASPSLTTSLPIKDNETVLVLCNTGVEELPLFSVGRSTIDDVNEAFPSSGWLINQDGANSGKGLPMSGTVIWNESGKPEIKMYRSVAKFQLELDIPAGEDATNTFCLDPDAVKWSMYNLCDYGNIYSPSGELNVTASTLAENYFNDESLSHRVSGAGGATSEQLAYYVREYENSIYGRGTRVSTSEFYAGRACMIVQTSAGYYRIDIAEGNEKTETKKFLDICRNHDYHVRITNVKSGGYTTIDEALNNPGSNLEYEVEFSEQEDKSISTNGQYSVTTDKERAAVTHDMTSPYNLVKFFCRNQDRVGIQTRKVRLVGADKKTLIPSSKLQLCKSDGTEVDGNEFEYTPREESGYQLKFKAPSLEEMPSGEVFVEISYGNIRHYVPVDTYVFYANSPEELGYQGGTSTFTVPSYKTDGNVEEYVGWDVTGFSFDEGETWTQDKPAWLKLPLEGTGDKNTKYTSTLSAQIERNEHNNTLQASAEIQGVYNLANQTSGGAANENTANCYVINAPGTYSLPLVYGNSIKNGAENRSSYHTDVVDKFPRCLTDLVGHDGLPVTSPYIKDATSASLIWEDTKGLISVDANLYGTYPDQTLRFNIPSKNIRQGNAVVAIKNDAGQILWSWHIWVTDYKLTEPTRRITDKDGKAYEVMPINIGWCDDIDYDGRKIMVRLTQRGTGFRRNIDIVQTSRSILGNSPLYNWGRKDPFPPSILERLDTRFRWMGNKINNNLSNWDRIPAETADTYLSQGILNPDKGWKDAPNPSWKVVVHDNLWSMNCTSTELMYRIKTYIPVVKTIYDPSPVGYKVAEFKTFNNFTTDGYYHYNDMSLIYGKFDYDRLVWTCSIEGCDDIDFPARGNCIELSDSNNLMSRFWYADCLYWLFHSGYEVLGLGTGGNGYSSVLNVRAVIE